MSPRRAGLVGLLFVAIASFYWLFQYFFNDTHVDLAGFTMLLALGLAMSIMAYVLIAGTRRG